MNFFLSLSNFKKKKKKVTVFFTGCVIGHGIERNTRVLLFAHGFDPILPSCVTDPRQSHVSLSILTSYEPRCVADSEFPEAYTRRRSSCTHNLDHREACSRHDRSRSSGCTSEPRNVNCTVAAKSVTCSDFNFMSHRG